MMAQAVVRVTHPSQTDFQIHLQANFINAKENQDRGQAIAMFLLDPVDVIASLSLALAALLAFLQS